MVHIHNGILLSLKKDEVEWLVTMGMHLERIHAVQNESDRKSQEPCDFTNMWNIKLKRTNEHIRQRDKNSLIQTTVWWLQKGRGGRIENGKGGQYKTQKETWLWVVNTQCNMQVIHHRTVHLKPM